MTDIEGSTRLIQQLGDQYPALLDDHYRLLREEFESAGGVEVSTEGDALFFAFSDAGSAVRATLDGQGRLAAHVWPPGVTVRVRMGIHTGVGTLLGQDYVGLDVHRAARIASAAHGGQIVVSDGTRALAEASVPEAAFRDLGEHRLKDLERLEHLFQLVASGMETEFPPLRSLDALRDSLPAQLSSFVGRAREKQQLLQLVDAARLVTLTGPGGTGKTRLSIEVAAAVAGRFPDGVVFVPLATITDPALLIPTLAGALGLREAPSRPVRDVLIAHIKERSILLVLDNFEQLIAAAQTVGELLAAAPRVSMIVTTREPLWIAGEQEFPVPALALPDRGRAELDQLRETDSVALFVQRARSVRPEFELTIDNAHAVAEICVRLDGLPLAIELAAARSRLFEPAELLSRLDRRLSFLAGRRDLPERQRTLRGAIDWSHQLLAQAEQLLFRRLSVFAGGVTIEAIEAICDLADLEVDVVDGVSSLYDKSLLRRDEGGAGELRVSMLETIREYARERLDASGEAETIRRRHAEFFMALAAQAAGHLDGREQQQWLDAVDRDLDNFRSAIRWAVDAGEAEIGLRLAASLSTFWIFRGHLREGRLVFDAVLAFPPTAASPAVRAAGLGAAADIAGWQADYEVSRPLAERALALYEQLGDVLGIARQLNLLGYAAATTDPTAARALFAKSIDAYRQAGSPTAMGQPLVGMALPEMRFGDLEEAASHLEEAARIFEAAGNETMVVIATGLRGVCARLGGDLTAAQRRYADALVRSQRLDAHIAMTLPLAAFADLALLEGDPERAAVLDAAVTQLRERLGGTPTFELMGIPNVRDRAHAELGDDRYDAAAARGRSAPLDAIVRLTLERATEIRDAARPGNDSR
jgi:predicted ATPase/class 3 adenylate cyclase